MSHDPHDLFALLLLLALGYTISMVVISRMRRRRTRVDPVVFRGPSPKTMATFRAAMERAAQEGKAAAARMYPTAAEGGPVSGSLEEQAVCECSRAKQQEKQNATLAGHEQFQNSAVAGGVEAEIARSEWKLDQMRRKREGYVWSSVGHPMPHLYPVYRAPMVDLDVQARVAEFDAIVSGQITFQG